jgi:hypothetical protein
MGKRISYGELMAPLMAPTIYSDLKPGELVTRGSSTRPCFEVVALWATRPGFGTSTGTRTLLWTLPDAAR